MLVAYGRCPLEGACLIDPPIPMAASGCRIITRADIVITRLKHPVHIRGKLVSRAHLPGQTQQYSINLLVVDSLPACNNSIVAICVGASRRDVERTGNRFINREETG